MMASKNSTLKQDLQKVSESNQQEIQGLKEQINYWKEKCMDLKLEIVQSKANEEVGLEQLQDQNSQLQKEL